MKRIIYAALACLTFASCEDFLDKQPIEQIGTDEYFKDEASLEKYTNGFLNSYTPSSGDVTRGDGNCDIIEVKQTSSYLYQPRLELLAARRLGATAHGTSSTTSTPSSNGCTKRRA